jgi:hypothetical protein
MQIDGGSHALGSPILVGVLKLLHCAKRHNEI